MSKDKMTPTPWKVKKFKNWATNVVGKEEGDDICELSNTNSKKVQNTNAAAIVSAVNNTYGAAINPEAIPELMRVLKWIIEETGPNEDSAPSIEAITAAKAALEKAKL